ncbi:MAG: queuosine precursor transporter [Holosporales bacterium]
MPSLDPTNILTFLQSLPAEVTSVLSFIFCSASVLLMVRLFGAAGLMVYIPLAVVAGNLQVLKASNFSFLNEPVALGTVVFTSTFLATDILTEYYGRSTAQKAVWLGFAGALLMNGFMFLAQAMPPVVAEPGTPHHGFVMAHQAINTLFTPAPALFVASLAAYFISERCDISLFSLLKAKTKGQALWLRTSVSTLVSGLIDTAIFSILAWIVFAPNPLPWSTVITTYILGTYWMRVIAALANTPIMYLSRFCVVRKAHHDV